VRVLRRRPWLPSPQPGRTCLVTGASAGIGAAIARELASRGHGVTLVARREERLELLAAELRTAHEVRAEPLPCDLADARARAQLSERVAALGLEVGVLVNDAGLGTYGAFVESDPQRQLEQVRVMSEAVVDLSRSFAPQMVERGTGGILTISSGIAFMPMARYATYGATRAFCLAFGDALHTELRQRGVAVSTVCPGGVRSEFFAANGPQPVELILPSFLWQTPASPSEITSPGCMRIVALARRRRFSKYSITCPMPR